MAFKHCFPKLLALCTLVIAFSAPKTVDGISWSDPWSLHWVNNQGRLFYVYENDELKSKMGITCNNAYNLDPIQVYVKGEMYNEGNVVAYSYSDLVWIGPNDWDYVTTVDNPTTGLVAQQDIGDDFPTKLKYFILNGGQQGEENGGVFYWEP